MDITSVMESITSMSEYFVATNTRTPYTDMADWTNTNNNCPTSSSAASQVASLRNNHLTDTNLAQFAAETPPNNSSSSISNLAQALAIVTPTSTSTSTTSTSNTSHNTFSSNHHSTTRTSIAIHTIVEQIDFCVNSSSGSGHYAQNLLSINEHQFVENHTVTDTQDQHHDDQHLSPSLVQSSHTLSNHPHHLQSKLALETVSNETNLHNNTHINSAINNNNHHQTENRQYQQQTNQFKTSHQTHYIEQQPIDTNAFRETYAIVSSNVLFIDLVRTVLLQLGYSIEDLVNAKCKYLRYDNS